MKLLPKQQLNVVIANQKKAQIDEGLTIAKKVDVLRQTLADLERQHNLFIAGMEEELKRRTESLREEIKSLEYEIGNLKDIRKDLLKPLDEAWEKVKERELEIIEKVKFVDNLKTIVNSKEERADIKLRKASSILSKLNVRDRESAKAYIKADEFKKDAEKIYTEANLAKLNQEKEFEEKEKQLLERESINQSHEFTLKIREDQIEIGEEQNRIERIRLLDQRGTLERAMLRLKKK